VNLNKAEIFVEMFLNKLGVPRAVLAFCQKFKTNGAQRSFTLIEKFQLAKACLLATVTQSKIYTLPCSQFFPWKPGLQRQV